MSDELHKKWERHLADLPRVSSDLPQLTVTFESPEASRLANYHRDLRGRLWLLLPLALACLCGGGLVVWAIVKAILAKN